MKLRVACLTLICLGVLPIGCSESGSRLSDRVVGSWRLFSMEGFRVPDSPAITLELGEDGNLSGSAGCNRYTTSFELGDEGGLTLGQVAVTRMACAEAVMETESKFLAALGDVVSAEASERFLDFKDAGGRPRLRFKADPAR